VLVTFENDDPDRPVIIGALHNHAQPSPVNAANASQNILRTPGGNELLMDDQRGAERIALTTRDEQLSLTLDATEGAHRLSLRTEQGDMDWYAGEGLTLECGADQTVQVGGEQHVTVEQAQRLVTKHAGIDYQAGTDIRLSAKETVRLESESADIAQRSEQDTAIEAGRNMRLNARGGDFDCLVEQGAARIGGIGYTHDTSRASGRSGRWALLHERPGRGSSPGAATSGPCTRRGCTAGDDSKSQ
jgi:type VI secretion system secreted protein VgrG